MKRGRGFPAANTLHPKNENRIWKATYTKKTTPITIKLSRMVCQLKGLLGKNSRVPA